MTDDKHLLWNLCHESLDVISVVVFDNNTVKCPAEILTAQDFDVGNGRYLTDSDGYFMVNNKLIPCKEIIHYWNNTNPVRTKPYRNPGVPGFDGENL
ncbi:hypothetical protein [Klebsiella oxytoca]|uniref:hypothetical protein n=1 Tax=Klebsiella oxytoca TaxID=571 RepID=UPI0039C9CED7